ncbi:MAG: hypothetical protein Q9190_001023 [Brigantiaea leucoxantha]
MECTKSTYGSYEPLQLMEAQIIFDRATGSTNPNSTQEDAVTAVRTSTNRPMDTMDSHQMRTDVMTLRTLSTAHPMTRYTPANSTNGSTPQRSESAKEKALGVGLGVPLGLILLTALGITLLRRRRRQLEANSLAVAERDRRPSSPATRLALIAALANSYKEVELDGVRADELDGTQRAEMGNGSLKKLGTE